MQNYYRILGVAPTAAAAELEQAYRALHARLSQRAARDPALGERLTEAYGGLQILLDPRRRWAYDQLLAQQPAPPLTGTRALMHRYAPAARWLNLALLAFCALLALDFGLPLRELPGELVLRRTLVSVSVTAANPQVAYDIRTPLTRFRLASSVAPRAREGQFLTVWRTPLLGVVRRISVGGVGANAAAEPLEPYGTGVYGGALAVLPAALLLTATIGAWPRRSPEMRVNTAVAGTLIWLLTVVVMWLF